MTLDRKIYEESYDYKVFTPQGIADKLLGQDGGTFGLGFLLGAALVIIVVWRYLKPYIENQIEKVVDHYKIHIEKIEQDFKLREKHLLERQDRLEDTVSRLHKEKIIIATDRRKNDNV